jgi:hypothetical protein
LLHSDGGLGSFKPDSVYADHFSHRLYTFFATLPTYLDLLLWPQHLHMEREFPVYLSFLIPRVLAGIALCCVMFACIAQKPGKSATPLGWGAVWFLSALLPCTGLLLPVNAVLCEHWMYLPTMGLALGIAAALDYAIKQPTLRIALGLVCAVLVSVLGCATFMQNEIWRDPVVFYQNIFAAGERAPRAHNNLGTIYFDDGDMEKAAEQYRIAIANSTHYATPRYNLALAILRQRTDPASVHIAITNLEEAVVIKPDFTTAYAVLADAYGLLGDSVNRDRNLQKAGEKR